MTILVLTAEPVSAPQLIDAQAGSALRFWRCEPDAPSGELGRPVQRVVLRAGA